ncbi:DNA-binding protein [Serratia sp. JSRIV004]|uniref:DNA-binding protein n=1 Tax=Serratia sp. JSRIV004 TaxID=2831895 RepID=UPI001CBE0B03|nr:DNA-binding protein [Serratia sp. JSRIV004]UAN55476.1 hypothetical protein KGP21_17430 [Serratia sp. JSRIV004]
MKRWLSIDELIALSLPGLPSERSALSRKANKENWEKRKRDTGKRGVTYEYLITSLPTHSQAVLTQTTDIVEPEPSNVLSQDSQKVLLQRMLGSLTEDEAEALNQVLVRKGVEFILLLLNDVNLQLLQLSSEEKERALRLITQIREGASSDSEGKELSNPAHKQAS